MGQQATSIFDVNTGVYYEKLRNEKLEKLRISVSKKKKRKEKERENKKKKKKHHWTSEIASIQIYIWRIYNWNVGEKPFCVEQLRKRP